MMKQTLVTLACALITHIAWAQLEKGTQLAGANISFNSHNTSSSDTARIINSSAVNLNLRYGRFVAQQVAIGISCPLTYSGVGQQSDLRWGGGPFLRYYSPFEESKLTLLLEARASYNQGTFRDRAINYTQTSRFLGGGVGMGVIYFFNESVGLETLFDYNYLTSLNSSRTESGLALNIGLQIYLNKYGF